MRKIILRVITYTVVFVIFFSTSASIISSPTKSSSLEDELNELEKKIKELEDSQNQIQDEIANGQYKLEGYNSQIAKLHGEILVFQKEIDKLELQLKELEVSIDLLDEQIAEKKQEIENTETAIATLEAESVVLIKSNYFDYRMYGGDIDASSVLNTADIANFYKDSQYKELIQSDTNDLMVKIAELRKELETAKAELDIKLANVKEEKAKVEAQRKEIAQKRGELDVKIAAFYTEAQKVENQIANQENTLVAFSKEQASKESKAEAIRNEIFNSFNPISNGEWLTAGRPIGKQGCTGLCTGDHLHFMVWKNGSTQNPCGFIAACGPALLQMPIRSGYSITSWYGNRCFDWGGSLYCDFHNGLDLAGSKNTTIYATHDGYAFRDTDPYGANYVIVCQSSNCQSGIKTGYWHLSSF